ncbi:MAG: glycosyltransferase family 39 protein [Chloroflexi bacterium]|nr:glycosyltransferase family 39 protein [Chloroflexota bacterium]
MKNTRNALIGYAQRHPAALEITFIILAVFLYCSAFLDLRQPTRLPGNEAETFQTLDWTLYNSLTTYHRFPLWNPYLQTGLPFVADPMLHAYNPLASLPVLLLGVRDGFKVAIFLSFLCAALGMAYLGKTMGISRPARLWIALTFAFAGQPAARFFQGQYLFVLGFAWIPWAAAALIQAARSEKRRYWALAVFALALLFFSGNVYYSFYMLVAVLLLALTMLLRVSRVKPYLAFDGLAFRRYLVIGVLTLGVIAVQWLPLAEFWPRLNKSLEVVGGHTPYQVYLDFTSKDSFRPDAYAALPAREEFYAYIGIAPFLALVLLPLALWKRERAPILFLGMLLLFVFLWINVERMPWHEAFLDAKILYQFRHLLRVLVFGGFAVILLAGLGLDSAWKFLQDRAAAVATSRWEAFRRLLASLALVGLAFFSLASVYDLYQTNRQHLKTQQVNPTIYTVLRWLRQYDLSEYYVRFNPNNTAQEAMIAANLRFIQTWYHFGDISSSQNLLNTRPLTAAPNYIVQSSDDAAPQAPGAALIFEAEGYSVYRLPSSLSYAFAVNAEKLGDMQESQPVQPGETRPLVSYAAGPNSIEIIADSPGDEALVALTSHYTGWRVTIDDGPATLDNVSGYLAVRMNPGIHKYRFTYSNRAFYLGLTLSLIASALTLLLLARDLRAERAEARVWLRSLPGRLADWRARALERLSAGRSVGEAVVHQGSLLPSRPLPFLDGSILHLSADSLPAAAPRAALRRWLWASVDLASAWLRSLTLPGLLFAAALAVYLFTRLWALQDFPIYFFGDEAVQTLFAEDLLARKFHSAEGAPFPIYVEAAGNRWTPLLSMYFHALAAALFGKSIFISRAVSALVSLLAALCVSLILRDFFKARYWWAGVLLVALTPAWFLHSRTAFETVMTASFYACFAYFYLLYRLKSPRYLYAAVLSGAAAFYSYSNAQAILLAAAALLFLSDLRYHWQQRAVVVRGLLLAAVLALPFISFRLNHPDALSAHLKVIGSYWFSDLSLGEKIVQFVRRYTYGLSPQYWFFPNEHDLPRHRMAGFGQMQTAVLPLALTGLAVSLWRWRSSAHRAVLILALATPVGAALVDVGIARILAFIVPANILVALGLEWLLARVKALRVIPQREAQSSSDRKVSARNEGTKQSPQAVGAASSGWRPPRSDTAVSYSGRERWIALGLFLFLAWANLSMLRIALSQGPLWFRDYGLYGMQYGAKQLFEEAIPAILEEDPQAQILVTSTWANGADNFPRFFYNAEQRKRVRMDGVEAYLFKKLPLDEHMVFVASPAEYNQALDSPKVNVTRVERVVEYPDGSPGFYFFRMRYSDDVDALFAAEKEARRQLVSAHAVLDGQTIAIRHSQIDMGLPDYMFDGDSFTLMRGMEANPFILELEFPEARRISGITADFGLVNVKLTAILYSQDQAAPSIFNSTFLNATGAPLVEMNFAGAPARVSKIRLEIFNTLSGETANIHIRELTFLP